MRQSDTVTTLLVALRGLRHPRSDPPCRLSDAMPSPISQPMWLAISALGAPVTMLVLSLAIAGALLARRRTIAAVGTLLIAGSGGLLDVALKAAVHRPRPPGAERVLVHASWSFPSGHAMGSLIGYGLLCYCLGVYTRCRRGPFTLVTASALMIVSAVGLSRIELGAHYPSDVLGGWLIGALWLGLGVALLRQAEARVVGEDVTAAR